MSQLKRPLPAIDPAATALVLIDLQRGIVGRELAPHSGDAVMRASAQLAAALRAKGGLIVRVHVSYGADGGATLRQDVDERMGGSLPPGWDEFADEAKPEPGDVVITKQQWGAFYGTELDLQLRRRGKTTIILGGIATNFGVESTARDAWERGYQVLLVEDAMTSMQAEAHTFAVSHIFPRLGRVCSTEDVLAQLGK